MTKWAFLLLFLAKPVWADWQFIGKTADFGMYADPASIQRKGAVVKMWAMGDYKDTQAARFPPPLLWTNYLSVKELKEFDCNSGLHRTVRTSVFAAHLAKGDPLYTFDSGAAFAPVANAPLDVAQFKFGCEGGNR
jgi:hypothetical protein